MDDELRDALIGLEARINTRFDAEQVVTMKRLDSDRVAVMARLDSDRVAIMARFDRLENKVGNLEAQFTFNVAHLNTLVAELDSRRAQVELLQEAIRAGIAAESAKVGSLHQLVAGLQTLMNRLQNQVDIIHDRLDEQARRETASPAVGGRVRRPTSTRGGPHAG